jgi:hypothetical protein
MVILLDVLNAVLINVLCNYGIRKLCFYCIKLGLGSGFKRETSVIIF